MYFALALERGPFLAGPQPPQPPAPAREGRRTRSAGRAGALGIRAEGGETVPLRGAEDPVPRDPYQALLHALWKEITSNSPHWWAIYMREDMWNVYVLACPETGAAIASFEALAEYMRGRGDAGLAPDRPLVLRFRFRPDDKDLQERARTGAYGKPRPQPKDPEKAQKPKTKIGRSRDENSDPSPAQARPDPAPPSSTGADREARPGRQAASAGTGAEKAPKQGPGATLEAPLRSPLAVRR
eukprot:tig00000851_g4903.t1